MTKYDLQIERCKRQDTKEMVIQCLDVAHDEKVKSDHTEAGYWFAFIVVAIIATIVFSWISSK